MASMIAVFDCVEGIGGEKEPTEKEESESSFFVGESELPSQYAQYADTFQKLASVGRYVDADLPENFIGDNVLQHTIRCVAYFLKLLRIEEGTGQVKSSPLAACERMLYIHDFGEAGVDIGDNNAVKSGKTQEYKDRECAAARKILSDSDFNLYSLFKAISGFLNGVEDTKIGQTPYDRAAILAKLIDSIDGNIVFHRALSTWIKKGNNIEEIPKGYISWMFAQYNQYKMRIMELNVPDIERAFFISLLDTQLFEVQNMWSADHPMPQVLAEKFQSVTSERREEGSQGA